MFKLNNYKTGFNKKIFFANQFNIIKALFLLKNFSYVNFIESVDVSVNLGIDVKKSDQNIFNFIKLPNNLDRNLRIAVFAQGINLKLLQKIGVDFVGTNNLVNLIKSGKFSFDIIVSSPDLMYIVNEVSSILGPLGLMPNIKLGTLTRDIVETVKNIKFSQICYRNDKYGIVHFTIGKINHKIIKLKENFETAICSLIKIKPISFKGIYIKKIILSTTMGSGLIINKNSLFIKNI